jgi:hypothetical protein
MSVTRDRQTVLEVVKRCEMYGHVERGINPAPFSWERKPRPTDTPADDFPMVPQCAAEIIECWKNGLESLILVVGNDDDMSEITLVPVEDVPERESNRFKQAHLAAEQLQKAVIELWNELDSNGDLNKNDLPPSIRVMTPRRAPLQSFSRFRELPNEIQDCIWKYAIQVPRVVELEIRDVSQQETSVVNRRIPFLSHVSSASRSMVLEQLSTLWGKKGHRLAYYNKALDLVLIPQRGHYSITSKQTEVDSLGILSHCEGVEIFNGKQAMSSGSREIVILGGRRPTKGWMTFEMLVDQETYPYPDSDICEAWYFLDGLKTEMAKLKKTKGKKWKGIIRPIVKMARLQPVLHTLSPYT